MPKKHKQKHQPPQSTQTHQRLPSAPTVFRFTILDFETHQEVERASQAIRSYVGDRDRASVERIERAKSAEEVLDLAVEATGLADAAWFERVRQFGPAIVPVMTQRLKASRDIADPDDQTQVREHLIAALRWRGTIGGQALQECFADLDEYAQGLAATVFGILHARASADSIWDLFQRTKQNPETYFVGALWGLIDLKDPRAADALAELLVFRRQYYEMYGFLARAGDAQAVAPFVTLIVLGAKADREQASYALSAMAHRIGREKSVAALKGEAPAEQYEKAEHTVDKLLEFPLDDIQRYFDLFYRGQT